MELTVPVGSTINGYRGHCIVEEHAVVPIVETDKNSTNSGGGSKGRNRNSAVGNIIRNLGDVEFSDDINSFD